MRFLATQDRSRSPRKELSLGFWVKLQGFGEKHNTGRSLPMLKFGRLPKKWRSLLNQRCFSILNLEGMKIVFQSSIFWDRFGKYQRC